MFPWIRTTAWLLAGARTATWSGPVELPLLHVDGDPRPAVAATVEKRPMVVHIDPFGPSRVGRLAAIRLGLNDERDRLTFDAELGPLHLDDVRAEVVEGDEVVVGLGALPEAAMLLDQDAGVLRLVRASEADDLGPFPTPLPRIDTRRTWASGPLAEGPLDAATRHTTTRGEGAWTAGRFRVGRLALDPRHPVLARLGEPTAGGDAMATLSIACDPGAAHCRFDPAHAPWTADADRVRTARQVALERLEERAATWTVPDPPGDVSVTSGDPGSSWQARRWLELSDAAWSSGATRRALITAGIATRAGRDRCEPWMVLGERLLRGAPDLDELDLADVAEPSDAATFLQRATHHLDLYERDTLGYTLRQPEACRGARTLLDEARLAAGATAEALETPLVRAVAHLKEGDAERADVALRRALADGGHADVSWLAVHVLVQLALERELPARATLQRLAEQPEADTLWVATIAAHGVKTLDGEAGLEWMRSVGGPAWQAVARRHLGQGRPSAPLSLQPDGAEPLGTAVALRLARSPGDATGWALARWLGHDVPEGSPTIDGAIVASWLGDPDADALLGAWPLAAAALAAIPGDPRTSAPRTMGDDPPPPRTVAPEDGVERNEPHDAPRSDPAPDPSLQETEMIPAIALATVALAADFDHTHTAFGEVIAGAVSTAGVDYGAIGGRRDQLDAYLKTVADVDASGFDASQKLALYVNAYNAYTIQTMLDAGAGVSILDLDDGKVWDKRTFPVAGQSMTLNQMEHENARKLADGRVHAVVNCASKGCPPLPPKAFSSANVGGQLTAATKTWASHNAFSLSGDTVALSKIFDWYSDDFVKVKAERDLPNVDGKEEQALWFLSSYVDDTTKAKLLSGELTATWAEYDWSRNAK